MHVASFALAGSGGEPLDFTRTIMSHGIASLPPGAVAEDRRSYRVTLRVHGVPQPLRIFVRDGSLHAQSERRLTRRAEGEARASVRRMFRLDEDLSPFYTRVAGDERLAWATTGAGRLLASPSVFEEIVKTICTTNCAWSGTIRMVTALVDGLGGGAFPTAEMMAAAPESWYRDVARAGYRGAYLRTLARDVARGDVDAEALLPGAGLDDDACERRLLDLPGVGPYAAAHIMMLLGRYHRLVLDSWTRPRYLELTKKKRAKDATIVRAFKEYGAYAGLAFWLFLTRDWVAS